MKSEKSAAGWQPLRGAMDALVSVLFPAACRVCRQPLATTSRVPVCQACLAALRRIQAPLCRACGRPLPPAAAAFAAPVCHACRHGLYHFDLARSFAIYDSPMERILLLLKYDPLVPLAAWFAARIEEVVHAEPALAEVDWIVPVPLDRHRLRERGYNQAELIARPLARRLGLPLATDLLRRLRSRPPKLKLSRRERWETVRGAFEAFGSGRVDSSRILLLDDVLTSGATLDACARALRTAGAAAVHAVTVARVLPRAELAASGDNPWSGPSVTP
jgi:ComF family protein